MSARKSALESPMDGGAGSGCDVADDVEAFAAMAVPGAASAQATPSAPIQCLTKMRNPSVSRAPLASDTRFANALLIIHSLDQVAVEAGISAQWRTFRLCTMFMGLI